MFFKRTINFLFCIFFPLCLFSIPILRYLNLDTTFYDLGLYGNIFFNSYDIFQSISYGHFQPYLILFSFLYNLFDNDYSVFFILIIQSSFILISAFLIKKYFDDFYFYCFILFPPIWYLAYSGFHLEFIVIFCSTLFFIFVKKELYIYALITTLLISFVKEVYIFLSIGLILWMLINCRNILFKSKKILLISSLLIFFNLFLFYFLVNFTLNTGGSFITSSSYSWLGSSINEIIITLITRPGFVLFNIFSKEKILLLILLISFCGLIGVKSGVFYSSFILLFIYLLSATENHIKINSHYYSVFAVPLCIAFGESLKIFNFKYIPLSIIFIMHVLTSPSPISYPFYSTKYSNYSLFNFINLENNMMNLSKLNNFFCNDRTKFLVIQNNINIACLFNRKNIDVFPEGITYPSRNISRNNLVPDGVLVDINKSLFLLDRSCIYRYFECTDSAMKSNYLLDYKYLNSKYCLKDNFGSIEYYEICNNDKNKNK